MLVKVSHPIVSKNRLANPKSILTSKTDELTLKVLNPKNFPLLSFLEEREVILTSLNHDHSTQNRNLHQAVTVYQVVFERNHP